MFSVVMFLLNILFGLPILYLLAQMTYNIYLAFTFNIIPGQIYILKGIGPVRIKSIIGGSIYFLTPMSRNVYDHNECDAGTFRRMATLGTQSDYEVACIRHKMENEDVR
jgi:hypothetical protein